MPAILDKHLRRRLFAETALRLAPRQRQRMPWYQHAILIGSAIFFSAFFTGLIAHLLLDN
jgi:hypothetical protein